MFVIMPNAEYLYINIIFYIRLLYESWRMECKRLATPDLMYILS